MYSKNTINCKIYDNVLYTDKLKSANNLDEIVLASTNYVNEDLNHSRKDNIKEFARGNVLLKIGENDYTAKVIIGFTAGDNMVLYDVVDFTKDNFKIKKVGNDSTDVIKNNEIRSDTLPTINSISDNSRNVNTSDKKFSLSSPVEQVGELIAVHNLSEEKLRGNFELGGMPAPSVAITKASMGHNGYGDISIVFGANTIDPEYDSRNDVFSADIPVIT